MWIRVQIQAMTDCNSNKSSYIYLLIIEHRRESFRLFNNRGIIFECPMAYPLWRYYLKWIEIWSIYHTYYLLIKKVVFNSSLFFKCITYLVVGKLRLTSHKHVYHEVLIHLLQYTFCHSEFSKCDFFLVLTGNVGLGSGGTPRAKSQGGWERDPGPDPGSTGAVWPHPPPTGDGPGPDSEQREDNLSHHSQKVRISSLILYNWY